MNQQHPLEKQIQALQEQIQALQSTVAEQMQAFQEEVRSTVAEQIQEFRSTLADLPDLISENQELKYWACYDSSTGDMRSLEDLRQKYED